LNATKAEVDAAFNDNFDIPKAMEALSGLVNRTNKYLAAGPKLFLLRSIATYVTFIFKVFST
jgi:hypothetical protein